MWIAYQCRSPECSCFDILSNYNRLKEFAKQRIKSPEHIPECERKQNDNDRVQQCATASRPYDMAQLGSCFFEELDWFHGFFLLLKNAPGALPFDNTVRASVSQIGRGELYICAAEACLRRMPSSAGSTYMKARRELLYFIHDSHI